MQHPNTARVIVTCIEDDDKSDFYERTVHAVTEYDADNNPLFTASQLWGTEDGAQSVGPGRNPDPQVEPFFPGAGGIRFVYFTFLPRSEGSGDIERYRVSGSDSNTELPGLADHFSDERPGMHITDTIDFVHVLSGEMILELDKREVLVTAGDTIIMRGAWHNWRNESSAPCTVASVLVGATRSD